MESNWMKKSITVCVIVLFSSGLTFGAFTGSSSGTLGTPSPISGVTYGDAGTDVYTLRLLGFSNDGGSTIAPSFTLYEDEPTESNLYAHINSSNSCTRRYCSRRYRCGPCGLAEKKKDAQKSENYKRGQGVPVLNV